MRPNGHSYSFCGQMAIPIPFVAWRPYGLFLFLVTSVLLHPLPNRLPAPSRKKRLLYSVPRYVSDCCCMLPRSPKSTPRLTVSPRGSAACTQGLRHGSSHPLSPVAWHRVGGVRRFYRLRHWHLSDGQLRLPGRGNEHLPVISGSDRYVIVSLVYACAHQWKYHITVLTGHAVPPSPPTNM